MNTVLVLSAILGLALGESVPNNTVEGVVRELANIISGADSNINDSTIVYWFFSKENPSQGIPVTIASIRVLDDTSFDNTRDTMFVVHGWKNTNDSDFITTVRNAIVANLDVNIFVKDWSEIADQDYISARQSILRVGGYLGDFIETLNTTYNINLSRTTLVGHSLGAHVVGAAGSALNGEIGVIVGLDPALPLFLTAGDDGRLNPSDAQFVQVIHTNGGFKGFMSPLGHSDYYPNGGGLNQPGCGVDIQGSCAHARAYEYYAESLNVNQRFVGVACNSYSEFKMNRCTSGATSLMGTYEVDKSASGKYYLDTNGESPYAKN